MKLNVPVAVILPITLSLLLFSNTSLSGISIQSTKEYGVNNSMRSEEIISCLKNCAYASNHNVEFCYANTFTRNNRTGSLFVIKGNNDYKNNNLPLLNAGGNILFSTTLSKASVELPSLATGVYFVRVKTKYTMKLPTCVTSKYI